MLTWRCAIVVFFFLSCSMCLGQTKNYSYAVKHYSTNNSELIHNRIDRLQFDTAFNLICFSPRGFTKILNWNTAYPIFEPSINHDTKFGLFYDEKGRMWAQNSNLGLTILSKDFSSTAPSQHKVLDSRAIGFNQMAFYFENGELLIYRGEDNQRRISLQKELNFKNYLIYSIDQKENIYLMIKDPVGYREINYVHQFSSDGSWVDSLDMSSKAYRLLKDYQPVFHLPLKKLKTEKNLNDFLLQNFELFKFSEDPHVFYDDIRQLFWYVNEDILYGFHPIKGNIHQIKLSNKAVKSEDILFHDNYIIIGTIEGLLVVEINDNHFYKLKSNHKRGYRRIKSIRGGKHYIFTDNLLFKLDTNYYFPEKILNEDQEYVSAAGYVDSKEGIWTNIDNSIKLYHREGEVIKTLYEADSIFLDNYPYFYWGYLEAENGIVWTIIGNKLFGFKDAEKKYEIVLSLSEIENVIEIIEADPTFLWACTSKGLLKVNRFDGTVISYSKREQDAQFIPALDVRDFHIDKEGRYWLATADNGLIHWDYSCSTQKRSIDHRECYQAFNAEFGFPAHTINGIEEDEFGFLWLSSENGLIRFHKESHHFEVFTMEDGTSDNEFNRLSHYSDKDGTMYFGGIQGLTIFHPKSFVRPEQKSELGIKRLYILEQKKKIEVTDSYRAKNLIKLDNNDQSIELVYSSTQNGSNQVSYRLNENKPWIKDETNKILLINPPFGRFNIYLKEEDIAGKITNQINIPVQTQFPFYYQIWFYFLLVLGSFVLAGLVLRWRSLKLIANQKRLEKIVQERTQKIETDKQTIEKQAHQLKELIQSRSNFFRNLVHDLKNPLTIINGSIKLMETNGNGSQALDDQKYLAAIRENSGIVLNITDEILLLSQLRANKLNHLKYASISILLFFEKLFATFSPKAILEGKNYELAHNLSEGIEVALDTSKIERIVSNLVSNAFKNTQQGDTITLKIFQNNENSTLKIEVIDTGKGIKASEIPYLFDPFYKAERYELPSYDGIGIGLAIVKELVQIYNGDINVTSKLGEGSSFRVLLPLHEAEVTTFLSPKNGLNGHSEATEFVSQQFKPTLIHHHILIVEDAKNVRLFLKEFLEPYFLITTASNSAEALKILNQSEKNQKSKSISLIITDLLMPNQDGFAFIEELKKNVKWNLLPIIVISSYESTAIRKQAADLGVYQFLNKPFDPIKLLQHIYEAVSTGKTEDSESKMDDFSYHSQLMTVINNIISERIDSKDLNVSTLSKEIAISKRQLNRIVNQQTGLPPAKYILELKLRKAKELLESKSYSSVSDVSYALGFKSPKYFSQLFKNRFNSPPSTYL